MSAEEKEAELTVHNLTDVETPTLNAYGLTAKGFEVCDQIVHPGKSVSVPVGMWHSRRSHYARLLSLKALWVGDIPEAYTKAKATLPLPASPAPVVEEAEEETPVEESEVEAGH